MLEGNRLEYAPWRYQILIEAGRERRLLYNGVCASNGVPRDCLNNHSLDFLFSLAPDEILLQTIAVCRDSFCKFFIAFPAVRLADVFRIAGQLVERHDKSFNGGVRGGHWWFFFVRFHLSPLRAKPSRFNRRNGS